MALFNCKTKSNELTQLHAKFMCNIYDKRYDAIGSRSNESLFVIMECTDSSCFRFSRNQNTIVNLMHTTPA